MTSAERVDWRDSQREELTGLGDRCGVERWWGGGAAARQAVESR